MSTPPPPDPDHPGYDQGGFDQSGSGWQAGQQPGQAMNGINGAGAEPQQSPWKTEAGIRAILAVALAVTSWFVFPFLAVFALVIGGFGIFIAIRRNAGPAVISVAALGVLLAIAGRFGGVFLGPA